MSNFAKRWAPHERQRHQWKCKDPVLRPALIKSSCFSESYCCILVHVHRTISLLKS